MTREQHKLQIMTDLRQCGWDRIIELRAKAISAIAHNKECFRIQNENGMNVPAERLEKNNARHVLVLECCDDLIALERSASN